MENTIRWGRVMKNDGILFLVPGFWKMMWSHKGLQSGEGCVKKNCWENRFAAESLPVVIQRSLRIILAKCSSCKNPDYHVQYKGISISIDFFRIYRSIHLFVCWLINWFWQPPGSQHLRRSTTSRQHGMNSAPKLSQSKFDSSIGRCSWGLDCFKGGGCFFFCIDSQVICNLRSLSLSLYVLHELQYCLCFYFLELWMVPASWFDRASGWLPCDSFDWQSFLWDLEQAPRNAQGAHHVLCALLLRGRNRVKHGCQERISSCCKLIGKEESVRKISWKEGMETPAWCYFVRKHPAKWEECK